MGDAASVREHAEPTESAPVDAHGAVSVIHWTSTSL
ncbi:hypothetical protein J2X52_002476 [Luteimonas sp. 3794]|nr:hypothetical protein [Luteimonas sp. 3794]